MDGWMESWVGGWAYDGWVGRLIDCLVDRWMDEWVGGWWRKGEEMELQMESQPT
jgi:hypothetical protein